MPQARAIASITITPELQQGMREHPEINWSEVCRAAIADRLGIQQEPPKWFVAYFEACMKRQPQGPVETGRGNVQGTR